MSWESNYYKNIHKRFNTSSETTQKSIKNIEQHYSFNSVYPNISFDDFQQILADKGYKLNKRDAKFLSKSHETLLEYYLLENIHLKFETARWYLRIVMDFIRFSPWLDINDIGLYLNSKFNMPTQNKHSDIQKDNTWRKYHKVICNFL